MNQTEKLLHIENVCQAMREGKEVQMLAGGIYVKASEDDFARWLFREPERFRVKPEPREWWEIHDKEEKTIYFRKLESKEAAEQLLKKHWEDRYWPNLEIVHVREVLP